MWFVGLIFIVCSFFMAKYREYIGNSLGEPQWAQKVGGIYNVVIILAILIFFWGVAMLTGTTDLLFAPIIKLFPGAS